MNNWLLVVPMLISVMSMLVALSVYRNARALVAQADQQLALLEKRIDVLTQGGVGMGNRLLKLEHKLKSLQSKQEDLSNADTNFAYSQAMQMLKQGTDTATVAASCGFSNSEAELMALVQNQLGKAVPTRKVMGAGV